MESNEEIRKEVFAWYGSAAYAAQCFEVELVILHTFLYILDNPNASSEDIEKIDLSLSKKTMGNLLRELEKRIVIHPEFKELLDTYREKRNFLMHHYFQERSGKFYSYEDCEHMIEELKDLSSTFKSADEIVQEMSKNVRKAIGLSEEKVQAWIDSEINRLRNT